MLHVAVPMAWSSIYKKTGFLESALQAMVITHNWATTIPVYITSSGGQSTVHITCVVLVGSSMTPQSGTKYTKQSGAKYI